MKAFRQQQQLLFLIPTIPSLRFYKFGLGLTVLVNVVEKLECMFENTVLELVGTASTLVGNLKIVGPPPYIPNKNSHCSFDIKQ